jgi:hypothetical protein
MMKAVPEVARVEPPHPLARKSAVRTPQNVRMSLRGAIQGEFQTLEGIMASVRLNSARVQPRLAQN